LRQFERPQLLPNLPVFATFAEFSSGKFSLFHNIFYHESPANAKVCVHMKAP